MKSKLAKQVFHLSSFIFNPGKIHEPPVHNRDIRRILRKIFHDFILSHSARRLRANFNFHLSLLLSLSLLLFLACETDKTPLIPNVPQITSHEYEWTVDTLQAPGALQVLMSDVWGTDENNVYVVGHSDETKYQVWHWDGEKWENIYLLFPGHPHSFTAIYGFSESDIWAVGTDFRNYPDIKHRSFIIKYNGHDWKLINEIDAPLCLSIWGISSYNLFVGCDSGIVLNYNGTEWKKQTTGTLAKIISIQGFNSENIYATGVEIDKSPHDSTFYYFFEYDGSKWNAKQSFVRYPFSPTDLFGYELWTSKDNILYSVGNDGLYERRSNAWTRLREEQLFAVSGTSSNNIFTAGPFNNVFHFNGNSWYRYEYFDTYSFDAGFDFWCNDNYVFMTAQFGYQSFVIRGN